MGFEGRAQLRGDAEFGEGGGHGGVFFRLPGGSSGEMCGHRFGSLWGSVSRGQVVHLNEIVDQGIRGCGLGPRSVHRRRSTKCLSAAAAQGQSDDR